MATALWPLENGPKTINKKHRDHFRTFSPVFRLFSTVFALFRSFSNFLGCLPDLLFLAVLEKRGTTHKNSKDSFLRANPPNPWKTSKKRSKKQGFPWKEKSKEIQDGKEKKILGCLFLTVFGRPFSHFFAPFACCHLAAAIWIPLMDADPSLENPNLLK